MKLLRSAFAAVCVVIACAIAHAQNGYTTVTGSAVGGSSSPAASATIYWQPMSGVPGVLGSAKVGGSGSGQISHLPYTATVTNGAFSALVPDALATAPNICYAVTVIDTATQGTILGAGLTPDGMRVNSGGPYGCVQPTGTLWSFDAYTPNAPTTGLPTSGGTSGGGTTYIFPGSLFSVSGSVVSLAPQAQNQVFASPLSGNGTPSFRYLSGADIAKAGALTNPLPNINGEIWVDGTQYATLNAAWTAAQAAILNTATNQTIRLGPGAYQLSSPLVEPSNGNCISIIGTAGYTQAAAAGVAAEGTVIYSPVPIYPATYANFGDNGTVIQLLNSGAAQQAQGCTFRNFTILAAGVPHGFNLQWFRGLDIENVAVKNSISDGILLGEASGNHQSLGYGRNITVSWDASIFSPSSRPNYGLNLQATLIDSDFDYVYVRNAKQAAVYNAGGGNVFNLIHGFGYPYTCTAAPCNNTTEANASAADASYATNYEVIDAGSGGNMYFNTYMDSPAIAAFDLKSNGVQINGGHIQWPDNTSFPDATFAEVESTVTSNLVISNVDCLNMSSTAGIPGSPAGAAGVWISYMGASGNAPTYSSVSNLAGCGDYVQQRIAARQLALDINGNNSSNTNFGAGVAGVTPKLFVTPLSTSGAEGAYEAENFAGGQGDTFFSGYSGQPSNFAVMADGTVRHTGLQTSVVAVTASAALTKANHIVLASAATGAVTLTLPSCYTAMPDGLTPVGMEFTVIKTDASANPVTLATASGQSITVLGSTSTSGYSITAQGGLTIACGPDFNYYAVHQITQQQAANGVSSFNGRTGAVSPTSGDYSFAQLSGQATNAQLPATLTAPTTGNAATASALAAAPSQCSGGLATGIAANGNANCTSSLPHMTWTGYVGSQSYSATNTDIGANTWKPTAAVQMTRFDIHTSVAPSGCTTFPVVGLYDATTSTWLATVTLASGAYADYNTASGVANAGDTLRVAINTAASGCTISGAGLWWTAEYVMH